jgi:DNA polymerase zeta
MAELADAIVESGRQTLEAAIRMVQGHPRWKARVVYGDTGEPVVPRGTSGHPANHASCPLHAGQRPPTYPRCRRGAPPARADSLFVLLPGRSRAEAFAIGTEIAAAVTAANPPPVVLKLEKARTPLARGLGS